MNYAMRSIIILGVVGIFALGYFLFIGDKGEPVKEGNTDTATTTTESDKGLGGIFDKLKGSDVSLNDIDDGVTSDLSDAFVSVTYLVEDQSVPHPDIEREAIFNSSLEELKTIMPPKFSETKGRLRKEPYSRPDWLDLAIYYKTIDDFDGAEEVWKYLTLASPNDSVSFNNLGDLYHYYYHDFKKAEEYMLGAIKRASDPSYFLNLFTLYNVSYKTDTNLAEKALIDGINLNKGDLNLLMELARYYEGKGENEKALARYREARPHAQLVGNTSLVDVIDQAIARLEN